MRRGFLEIKLDVLEGFTKHDKITHVLYHSNVSFRRLKHLHIPFLIEKELLTQNPHYRLTEKGKEIAELWKKIKKKIEGIEC